MRTARRLLLLPLASLALFAGCGEQDKQHRQVLQALEDLRVEVAQLREAVARLEAAATEQAATQSGQVETGAAEFDPHDLRSHLEAAIDGGYEQLSVDLDLGTCGRSPLPGWTWRARSGRLCAVPPASGRGNLLASG